MWLVQRRERSKPVQACGLPIVEHDGFGKLNTAMHDTMADGSDRRLAELPVE
jgi:hypothetical protein